MKPRLATPAVMTAATLTLAIVGVRAAPGLRQPSVAAAADTAFSHPEHARLFPTCVTCHEGAAVSGAELWPAPESCAACHDGTIEQTVTWTRPTAVPVTNLRFDHTNHRAVLAREEKPPAACIDCHTEAGEPWMSVHRTVRPQCLECHEIRTAHLEAPDATCATCHVPLAKAAGLPVERVRAFEAPPSHDMPDFTARGGHGLLAYGPAGVATERQVAASCATCHARDFCIQCHVDAPEQPAIQALEPDERSLVHSAALARPSSHEQPTFWETHRETVRSTPAECRTCHTQESCLTCHVVTPRAVAGMHPAGSGRGRGAQVVRKPPPTHRVDFRERHGNVAAARPETCAACHAREDCLDCHRPQAAAGGGAEYHPATFLARHPAAAYAQANTCSDCHNTQVFCASCHAQAGLVADEPLRSGFHDAKRAFIAGHGQAARQSLESCVSCHAERDCLSCHSAVRGRRFSPHGPGFDAERLRRRAPSMCAVCHGTNIPGGS